MYTEEEFKLFESKGISREKAIWQLELFEKGVEPVKLIDTATVDKGIVRLFDIEGFVNLYNEKEKHVVKFVPASGAASRMFKELFEFRDLLVENPKLNLDEYPEMKKFLLNIKKFPFYEELNRLFPNDGGVERLLNAKNYEPIITKLLTSEGLNYGMKPKGLLAFHFYAGSISRTPFEEHLVEGAKYATSSDGIVYLHFTVSDDHQEDFQKLMEKAVKKYQEMYFVNYHVSFSTQKPSTDTLAVTPDNKPFYKETGEILFRPGGHGALIENLNDIDADLIFIKNIDNVIPEKRLANTVKYKKALAGYLLDIQQNVFRIITELQKLIDDYKNKISHNELINEAFEMLTETFCQGFDNLPENIKDKPEEFLLERLNRPIRVCGVVRNHGEPGGGPFLIKDSEGFITPQIIESSQVNLRDIAQEEIFNKSTHFNPVDIICAVRDFKGDKFNLLNYVDKNTCYISNKSFSGNPLKALELPGLWNGGMAYWNTVFVEVLEETFNPVKKANDLLREAHQ